MTPPRTNNATDAALQSGSRPPLSGLLTPEQLGEQLGVTKAWIYARSREWVKSNGRRGIPTVKLGRYYRYRPEAIERWATQLENGEAEA